MGCGRHFGAPFVLLAMGVAFALIPSRSARADLYALPEDLEAPRPVATPFGAEAAVAHEGAAEHSQAPTAARSWLALEATGQFDRPDVCAAPPRPARRAGAHVRQLPPLPSSAALFLAGMASLGALKAGRSVRRIHLAPLPDWYHAGGPAMVGHACPFDLDSASPALCLFAVPVDRPGVLSRLRPPPARRPAPQFASILRASRPPPYGESRDVRHPASTRVPIPAGPRTHPSPPKRRTVRP